MTPGTILTAFLTLALASPRTAEAGLRQIITRNVTGVQLGEGNVMEIVQEQTCSASLVRLTCRSLHSFVFVLEATYQPNRTDACVYDRQSWCRYKALFAKIRTLQARRNYLVSRYPQELTDNPLDFRDTINRRCSGHNHCRYRVMSEHPEALFWKPANIRIRYACIPEASVYKYCNADVTVPGSEAGGYLKSPGYPLYYLGGITCGWSFRALPGQRIVLTFHDFSIRDHERDGSCVDVVRVRDNGNTLFESCGTLAGVKVISNTNVVTLNLVASAKLYPARGFFLQYQVLGCPDVTAPPGSYVCNGTLATRTFLCRAGTLFPDTGQRTRTIHCRDGEWKESVHDLPACVASSAAIVRDETDGTNRLLDVSGSRGVGVLGQETGIERTGTEDAVVKIANYSIMDQTQPAMIKQADYVVDVILPMALIALLFVGNAIIVYIIFQYRKRLDPNFRKTPAQEQEEDISLNVTTNGQDPHV